MKQHSAVYMQWLTKGAAKWISGSITSDSTSISPMKRAQCSHDSPWIDIAVFKMCDGCELEM